MPTKFSEVKSNIRQRLATGMGSVPVLYDNMPKTQVRTGGGEMPTEFVHLTIYNVDHDIKTIGSNLNRVRYSGVFDVNIFTPIAQGDRRSNEIADIVATLFNNVTFSNIDTRIDRVVDVGNGGQYWQSMIAIVFECDYTE